MHGLSAGAGPAARAAPEGGSAARRGRGQGSEAEKEGFEPSRQGFSPPNALAGRRLQPLGHFSAKDHRIAEPSGRYPVPRTSEGWQSGPMRPSRKPFGAVTSREGSNPSPSASQPDPAHAG